MRNMMAIVTPQEVVNEITSAVLYTTGNRTNIPGAQLDHVGFVVSGLEYDRLREAFAADLEFPVEVSLPTGGRAVVGRQGSRSQVKWYSSNLVAALALVDDPTIELPNGGGYMAVRVSDVQGDGWNLPLDGAKPRGVTLMGHKALRVDLDTYDNGVGPGVFALFIVERSLVSMAEALPHKAMA
jgi:hypothetical protein